MSCFLNSFAEVYQHSTATDRVSVELRDYNGAIPALSLPALVRAAREPVESLACLHPTEVTLSFGLRISSVAQLHSEPRGEDAIRPDLVVPKPRPNDPSAILGAHSGEPECFLRCASVKQRASPVQSLLYVRRGLVRSEPCQRRSETRSQLRGLVGALGVAPVALVMLDVVLAVVSVEACPGARCGRAVAVLYDALWIPFGASDPGAYLAGTLVRQFPAWHGYIPPAVWAAAPCDLIAAAK